MNFTWSKIAEETFSRNVAQFCCSSYRLPGVDVLTFENDLDVFLPYKMFVLEVHSNTLLSSKHRLEDSYLYNDINDQFIFLKKISNFLKVKTFVGYIRMVHLLCGRANGYITLMSDTDSAVDGFISYCILTLLM